MNDKIAIIYGTRPEFLKIFPVVNQFRQQKKDVFLVNTGQHDDLLTKMEESFGIIPDARLAVQSLDFTNSNLVAKLINSISDLVHKESINKIVAQGDTFTVLASSIVSFMEQKKFYHIEAGLRTSDIKLPFPEEYNRRVVSLGTDINFAPTELSKTNLIKDGIAAEKILLTGNTIVDMIQLILDKENIEIEYQNKVFITAHRRENIGQPLQQISRSIMELANENPDIIFEWALHPNPNTRKIILDTFNSEKPENLIFLEPLAYVETIKRMAVAKLIISDSGGIQEEAPSLRKRVLILREETERPEVLDCNCGILVGSDPNKIKSTFRQIWNDPKAYIFENKNNPFGDGKASERIVKTLLI
ncbi:non-hydrolyzing UDP-N-acetylglucosamine 2-epimerase [Epilithonimonas arachidiradicis]|uniref:UDP-N-acetylglucosamine 2-epimerase (non-hydrolyzing) n=1 Tax=Epilithonimonas arachidiradicis TaxID=1617282 RepID=A0A420DDA7_9FLAO|nr:UDP-N-acetylglucosamine 2-epimerase (non-hydrolyzing) [Epilithonimonas arachidiradicis]RKE89908.1 UDP-N-acetylglucosamine 2-epimerase (non-hydrolysing) [Epilithonimonas arachidiradicis]GGG46222.1 UDP-N-acetyl glucosamine 2-epimerase [Epilithonimonas arachidiradicis]